MVIDTEPLSLAIPLLMSDEYLASNITDYNYAIENILKSICSNNEDMFIDSKDSLKKIEHFLSIIEDNFIEDNSGMNVMLSFADLYTIRCEYHIDTYVGPLDYRLISFRNYLSKSDAYCIKIIYSLYHWENYNQTFNTIIRELGLNITEPNYINPIHEKYRKRCVDFLSNHISKNNDLNELINKAIEVFCYNPCYEQLIYIEHYTDEYNIGYSFEGFVDFSIFEQGPHKNIDEYISQYDEACYTMIENTITFDIRYMINQKDFSSNYDYFFNVLYAYTNFIFKWNDFSEKLISNIQLKLDL